MPSTSRSEPGCSARHRAAFWSVEVPPTAAVPSPDVNGFGPPRWRRTGGPGGSADASVPDSCSLVLPGDRSLGTFLAGDRSLPGNVAPAEPGRGNVAPAEPGPADDAAGLQPTIALQASAPDAVADLALRGLGIGILSESMTATHRKKLVSVMIGDAEIPAVLALVWRAMPSPALRELLRASREAFGHG